MSKLINGLIPKHTECPFRNECKLATNEGCKHKGVNHLVDFSCAIARGLDIIHSSKAAKEENTIRFSPTSWSDF